jgi:hypothetical protein
LAARGVPSPKAGDAVTITWQGGDRWLVRHAGSGKQFGWRWKIPPVRYTRTPVHRPGVFGFSMSGLGSDNLAQPLTNAANQPGDREKRPPQTSPGCTAGGSGGTRFKTERRGSGETTASCGVTDGEAR